MMKIMIRSCSEITCTYDAGQTFICSVISFIIMLLYIPVIAKRIHNEEKVLAGGLEGYAEYKQRIRYKVIPFVW